MGKKQKYSEDLLLEAVVKYAKTTDRKIKVSELARWASKNIQGLEDVHDYHFLRTIRVKNEKTGKVNEVQKKSAIRIAEINKERSLFSQITMNSLLTTSDLDALIQLPSFALKQLILDTRNQFKRLTEELSISKTENEKLKEVTKQNKIYFEEIKERLTNIEKEGKVLKHQLNTIIKAVDRDKRKKILQEMGIEDEKIILERYSHYIKQQDAFAFNDILSSFFETIEDEDNLVGAGQAENTEENGQKSIKNIVLAKLKDDE